MFRTRVSFRSVPVLTVLCWSLLVSSAGATDASLNVLPGDQTLALSWQALDGAGSYRVTRDGDVVATLPPEARTWTDTGRVNGSSHAYQVLADVNGVTAAVTEALEATPVDLTPPSPPDRTEVYVLDGGAVVSWWVSPDVANDAVAYHLYVNGELAGVSAGASTSGRLAVAGLAHGLVDLAIGIVDQLGNIRLTPRNVQIWDLEPPAIPIKLRVDACASDRVRLSWDAVGGSGGDASVSYTVRVNGNEVLRTAEQTAEVANLTAGVTSHFSVRARDAASNPSAPTYEVAVTPLAVAGTKSGNQCIVKTPETLDVPAPPDLRLVRSAAAGTADVVTGGGTVVAIRQPSGDSRRYAGYRLYVDGALTRTGSLRIFTAVPLDSGGRQRTIEVELVDLHGQVSPRRTLSVQDLPHLAPAPPRDLQAATTGEGVTLTWQPGDGGAEPVRYEIEVDGRPHTAVNPGQRYELAPTGVPSVHVVRVRAIDADGHRSLPSSHLTVTSR